MRLRGKRPINLTIILLLNRGELIVQLTDQEVTPQKNPINPHHPIKTIRGRDADHLPHLINLTRSPPHQGQGLIQGLPLHRDLHPWGGLHRQGLRLPGPHLPGLRLHDHLHDRSGRNSFEVVRETKGSRLSPAPFFIFQLYIPRSSFFACFRSSASPSRNSRIDCLYIFSSFFVKISSGSSTSTLTDFFGKSFESWKENFAL